MVQSPLLFHTRVFGTFNNLFSVGISNEHGHKRFCFDLYLQVKKGISRTFKEEK